MILCILSIYALSALYLPFPNWSTFTLIAKTTLLYGGIPIKPRIRMLLYLLKEFALIPIWSLFWLVDEIFFSNYKRKTIASPIFIFSQPRSGTTFLLRTLSKDNRNFLSVKHMEWRYPYISFWKLLDLLKLRDWLENKSYWPSSILGRECQKIHAHTLGNYEEFGIFLEERFFHHYFTFRRFPFPEVLERTKKFNELTSKEKSKMTNTFLEVVKKVYAYRGTNEIFLAKM
jgi:hypothetical protein